MKTKLFYFLIVFILMGFVMPSYAVSPEKNKGNKTKVENRTPPPPNPWQLEIDVTDACDTINCPSIKDCNIRFVLEAASYPNCIGLFPLGTYVQFVKCQSTYYVQIPDTITCVWIRPITVSPPTCTSYFNPSNCCTCRENGPCKIAICK